MIPHGQHHSSKTRRGLFLLLGTCLFVVSFFSAYTLSSRLQSPTLRDNRTSTTITRLSPSKPKENGCRTFNVSDTRPFFVRDHPQSNIPRRMDSSSDQIRHKLRLLRLVVVACARDVESKVDNYRRHVEPIIDLFHSSSRLLILESDSSDKTVEKLRQWPRAQLFAYGHLSSEYPSRTDRLAYCRNTLLSKAHEYTADYILVTDFDIFSTSVASFLTNFQYDANAWAVMTASISDGYYDIWALRTLSDSVMNYDIWHRVWGLQSSPEQYCHREITDMIVGIHQKHIPVKHDLIEVRSAYGGTGLYRANATQGCLYDGQGPTCEHVPFHLCIREKNRGRIFINPAFLAA